MRGRFSVLGIGMASREFDGLFGLLEVLHRLADLTGF